MAAAAKILILALTAAGLLLQAWLGSREWPPLLPLTIAALAAGFALVRYAPLAGWAPLLATAFIYPAIFYATREYFTFSYYAVWFAGLFGAVLAAAHPGRWHVPEGWRLPLVFWALILGLGWPVIALREMNFIWGSIDEYSLANSGLGGPPPVVIVTMLVAVLPQILGILWFDALFAQFAHVDTGRFRRAILLPLAAGLMLSAALAIYQWTVDINFLNAHQWPFYQRAGGGLVDGNASGALSGASSAAALAWGLAGGWLQAAIGLAITLVSWLALWATGSRMAVAAGLIGMLVVGYAALRGTRGRIGAGWLAAAIGAVAVLAVTLSMQARWEMDPITRTIASLPEPNRESVSKFVEFELWNRFGPFGTASVQMVKDSPAVGIGAGTFEAIYPDYAYAVTDGRTRSHFDNAQSWYRHQLAELGLVGSLGWIVWGGLFAVFVWQAAPARAGLAEATGVKGAIVALALISIVSMPTRNRFVSLAFWVFAFWLVKLAGAPAGPRWLAAAVDRRLAWAGVWVLALIFVAGTAWTGYTQLRPPHRAMMAAWDYVNGVSRPVRTPDGIRRYTDEHGVAVFRARPGAYLKLAFQVAHGDAGTSPVRVKIFQGDVQVAHFVIGDRNWHELYIRVPEDAPNRMMLKTTVDRAAGPDAAARGLILRNWEFVGKPPPDAMVAHTPDESQ